MQQKKNNKKSLDTNVNPVHYKWEFQYINNARIDAEKAANSVIGSLIRIFADMRRNF